MWTTTTAECVREEGISKHNWDPNGGPRETSIRTHQRGLRGVDPEGSQKLQLAAVQLRLVRNVASPNGSRQNEANRAS